MFDQYVEEKELSYTAKKQTQFFIYSFLNLNTVEVRSKVVKLKNFRKKTLRLKNLPANAGDMGLTPSLGRSHMLQNH